jgi:hypothetical protein
MHGAMCRATVAVSIHSPPVHNPAWLHSLSSLLSAAPELTSSSALRRTLAHLPTALLWNQLRVSPLTDFRFTSGQMSRVVSVIGTCGWRPGLQKTMNGPPSRPILDQKYTVQKLGLFRASRLIILDFSSLPLASSPFWYLRVKKFRAGSIRKPRSCLHCDCLAYIFQRN